LQYKRTVTVNVLRGCETFYLALTEEHRRRGGGYENGPGGEFFFFILYCDQQIHNKLT
jgi:hypothetical protein